MIIDRLSNAHLYKGIHPLLAKGFDFLLNNDLAKMAPGKYEIDGTDVKASISDFNTIAPEEGRWECHKKYTDIQYVVSGEERMGYAHVGQLKITEEREKSDLWFLEGDGDYVLVREGSFAVFLPEDAHMPLLMTDQPRPVRKVVVKVAMNS